MKSSNTLDAPLAPAEDRASSFEATLAARG
jgi:hypothetical protein